MKPLPGSSRKSAWIVLLSLMTTLPLGWLAIGLQTNTQDINNWIENDSTASRAYREFVRTFGLDDYVMVSWPGCQTDDPRLKQLQNRILQIDARQNPGRRLIADVVTGRDLLAQMTSPDVGLSDRLARRRLRGIVFSRDLKTTCLTVQLSKDGNRERRQAIALLQSAIDATTGLTPDGVYMGGNAYLNNELDIATSRSMRFAVPACLLAFAAAWISLGSLRLTLITLCISGMAALTSLGLVALLGFKVNGLLVLMPVLVLVVTLSSAVHLVGYFRKSWALDPNASRAARRAVRMGWRPSSFAMGTTAIGVGSLGISDVSAVREFGLFSSVSILLGLVYLLASMPSWLTLFFDRRPPRRSSNEVVPTNGESPGRFYWLGSPLAVASVLFVAAGMLIGGLAGVRQIETNLEIENLFPPNHPAIVGHRWLDENVIPLRSVEVMLEFPESEASMIDQLETVRRVQARLLRRDGVRSSFSVASWVKDLPRGDSAADFFQRSVMNQRLHDESERLRQSGYFQEENRQRFWRITLGVNGDQPEQFLKLVDELGAEAEDVIAQVAEQPAVSFTGIWTLAIGGQNQLFRDLTRSFFLALMIITPLVMILLRGIIAGAAAMIPNVAPPAVFFGALGWIQYPIDIGMILTASVGLGIAVDNTFHLLYWFGQYSREGTASAANRIDAARRALGQVRSAMLQTTLICCSALLVFALSEFVPVRQFAVSIVIILLIALASDLVLLPSMIASRLGLVFSRR